MNGIHPHQAELNNILRQQCITPLFQPIVHLASEQVLGYESLSRGPKQSPLHSANALFEAAEQCHRLPELEKICVHKAAAAWPTFGLNAQLFINLSPDMLLHSQHHQWELPQLMQRHHLSPHQVVFEISERTPALQLEELKSSIHHLQAQGFSIAIDDMGSGYSGLKLWSELQPDFVKIDRYFIHNIDSNPIKLKFVRSLVQLSQQLGCQLIAEGVETRSELLVIADLGIDLVQGYLFGHPQPTPLLAYRDHRLSIPPRRQLEVNSAATHSEQPMHFITRVLGEAPLIPTVCSPS
ncbi:EAL domain-containing protein [Vibrio metoecus]|uniref:Diguanylate phosphodiesterase n=1 Tax=Vibrio metoecus TaxID=1481663 RepID=A0A0Q0MUV9_VIBMT|nr:EAL domain-containing protein [Vibrio metoecus]KQA23868.1 diguanylate phosphodiesterase [Vibrio metoecus]KQA97741.1 diguanylate phosphodiesterase [Vibrio metoecus]PAR55729.1 EAL domain-containing protein [Vibrio metoecus]PAR63541.1 EAL domain-containing protein [Vibrio metoecus]